MKWKFFLLIGVCFALASCGGNTELDADAIEDNETTPENPLPSGPKGTPEFGTDTAHSFGQIIDGERVSHEFEFTNIGEGDLIINSAKASCGCTTSDYTKTAIKPGEKGYVKAEFNSKGRGDENASPHEKHVTVDFSNSTIPIVDLKFTANILKK